MSLRIFPGGWRTAALVNTVLIAIVSALMTIVSAVALIEAQGFNKPLVLFTGACGITGASALNATLHIIINILSTAILASSNMFMQVLNAPSREEVDHSHARGSWLEIGVLSWRNILRLSPFKTIAWLGFLISSVPIHLLFNSAIFQASYRFSQYDLAIVSEQFLHGGNYFTPGASLLNSGGLTIYDAKKASSTWPPDLWAGYGDFVGLTEYRDNHSAINEKIAATAQNGSTWRRISKEACKQEYLTCSGLSTHSGVIIVVSDTEGWPRSHVWSLNREQISFWDAHVPDDTSEPEHTILSGFTASVRCLHTLEIARPFVAILAGGLWVGATLLKNGCCRSFQSTRLQTALICGQKQTADMPPTTALSLTTPKKST